MKKTLKKTSAILCVLSTLFATSSFAGISEDDLSKLKYELKRDTQGLKEQHHLATSELAAVGGKLGYATGIQVTSDLYLGLGIFSGLLGLGFGVSNKMVGAPLLSALVFESMIPASELVILKTAIGGLLLGVPTLFLWVTSTIDYSELTEDQLSHYSILVNDWNAKYGLNPISEDTLQEYFLENNDSGLFQLPEGHFLTKFNITIADESAVVFSISDTPQKSVSSFRKQLNLIKMHVLTQIENKLISLDDDIMGQIFDAGGRSKALQLRASELELKRQYLSEEIRILTQITNQSEVLKSVPDMDFSVELKLAVDHLNKGYQLMVNPDFKGQINENSFFNPVMKKMVLDALSSNKVERYLVSTPSGNAFYQYRIIE